MLRALNVCTWRLFPARVAFPVFPCGHRFDYLLPRRVAECRKRWGSTTFPASHLTLHAGNEDALFSDTVMEKYTPLQMLCNLKNIKKKIIPYFSPLFDCWGATCGIYKGVQQTEEQRAKERGTLKQRVEGFRHGPPLWLKAICFCQGTKFATPGRSDRWIGGRGLAEGGSSTRCFDVLAMNCTETLPRWLAGIRFKEELLVVLFLWKGAEPHSGDPIEVIGGQFDERPDAITLLHHMWLI